MATHKPEKLTPAKIRAAIRAIEKMQKEHPEWFDGSWVVGPFEKVKTRKPSKP